MSESLPSPPSPRSLCHATGFFYQSVGFVLALGACCWWSFTGLTQEPAARPTGGPPGQSVLEFATAGQVWAMLAVCISFAGGLAIVALGLGLQSDRAGSGRAAMWTTGPIALFFWCYLGFAVWKEPQAGRILFSASMAVMWSVGFLLAGVSADEQRRNPPRPVDPHWTSRDEDDLRSTLSPRSPDRTNP